MTKYSLDSGHAYDRPTTPVVDGLLPPAQRDGTRCDLYEPGHQIHYKHQGDAVRSPAMTVRTVQVEGSLTRLHLEGGGELTWRHHDPERLTRLLELLRGRCVAYPAFHALRIGPYWFNCATETDEWQECQVTAAPRPA